MRMSEGEKARSKVGCWPGLRGQDIPQSSELEGPSPQNTPRSSQQLSRWKILEEGSGKIRGSPRGDGVQDHLVSSHGCVCFQGDPALPDHTNFCPLLYGYIPRT